MRSLLITALITLIVSSAANAAPTLPNPCALLTSVQVAPLLAGTPASRKPSSNRESRTCTWTGPPLGYTQTQSRLYVAVHHITKSKFLSELAATHEIPISGLGTPAYGSLVGLTLWKNNTMLELFNPNLAVTPSKAIALARAALKNL